MGKVIEIQEFLRPVLPRVLGCKDYAQEEELFFGIDRILRGSGIEDLFLELSLERFEVNAAKLEAAGEKVQSGPAAIARYLRHGRAALRCMVLKNVVGGSYRKISKGLAMSPLYQWFAGAENFEVVRVASKTTLHDYAHWLPIDQMTLVLDGLTKAMADGKKAREIGLLSESNLATASFWPRTPRASSLMETCARTTRPVTPSCSSKPSPA